MFDKAKLGRRFTCFRCGIKFYDLNREPATCPECEADQAEAPVADVRSLLSGRGRPRPTPSAPVSTSLTATGSTDIDDADGDDDSDDDFDEDDDD